KVIMERQGFHKVKRAGYLPEHEHKGKYRLRQFTGVHPSAPPSPGGEPHFYLEFWQSKSESKKVSRNGNTGRKEPDSKRQRAKALTAFYSSPQNDSMPSAGCHLDLGT